MNSQDTEESNPDDHQLHKENSRFDIDVLEEASFILWSIWKTIFPRYHDLRACLDALKSKELYTELKASHRRRSYKSIRNWAFCSSPSSSVARSPHAEDLLSEYLTALKASMAPFVKGAVTLPTWTPPEPLRSHLDSQTLSHLTKLQLPCLRGKPNVLLHDLGCFIHEPDLQKRIQNVFMPSDPSHTILINTSGSGKTRLLFEGLCQNWGFYFTSSFDSHLQLGSGDVQGAIEKTIPNTPGFCPTLPPRTASRYESAVETNAKIAANVFRRVFLARILIFELFVEIMNEEPQLATAEEYRRRWLLLQLQPHVLSPKMWDAFLNLSDKLAPFSDGFVDRETKEVLGKISTTLSTISGAGTKNVPLYCVVDEAQFAATQHLTAFRSSSLKDAAPRPILRPLVQAIPTLAHGQGVFLILAGTGLSQSTIDEVVKSAVMKPSEYRRYSDTGSFEGWDGMAAWVGKLVPEWIFSGKSGERLKERMGYWLSGRHRFTAEYVAELLAHGFQQPHRLLNAYIHHFTGFDPTDAGDTIAEELKSPMPLELETRYKLDFSKLARRDDMMTTIRDLVSHYLIRSSLPGPLGTDDTLYVEYGFARFKYAEQDTNKRTRSGLKTTSMAAVLDEPLVLAAANCWLDKSFMSNYRYFAKHIRMHCPSSSDSSPSNGFENYIVYCIDLLFATRPRRVKDVFNFYGPAPSWAELHAELVSLYALPSPPSSSQSHAPDSPPIIEEATTKHTRFSGPSATLGTNAKTPNCTLEWLSHRLRAAVCFPSQYMGPDILFILRLADGKLLWVALQTKFCRAGKGGNLGRKLVESAVRSVTPKNFFLYKSGHHFSRSSHPTLIQDTLNRLAELPNKCQGAGRYSLLRAIASFPARADLGRCTEEAAKDDLKDTADGHPIATLNMELVKEITKNIPPVNSLESWEPSKKSGKKVTGGKRKGGLGTSVTGGAVGAVKKRKIKLN